MPNFADAIENLSVRPRSAIGLIRPLAFSLIAAQAAASFAQETRTANIMGTTLSGGSVGKTKIISAIADSKFTLSYRDADGREQTKEVKAGDSIGELAIETGEISVGTASGGILTWPATVTVDRAHGTVAAESLEGTLLRRAALKNVTPSAEQQEAKIRGEGISGDSFKADPPFQIKDASLERTDVKGPAVPVSLVQATQQRPAGTEAAGVSTVGDYFKFNAKVEHFRASSGEPRGEVTAPKGSCFRVSQEFDDPNEPTQKLARGIFITGWFPRLLLPPYKCLDEGSLKNELLSDPDLSYDVPKRMIVEERDRDRFGWTYGALVAPFKYYTKDREFSASASVGPYLGYRLHDRQGSSSVLALGIGIATASVKTNNPDGSTSTSNTTGMSAALAYLLEIKGTFNLGFVAGADYFSKSQDISSSGKLWLGLSFGYKLD